jgi:hypothetical protein
MNDLNGIQKDIAVQLDQDEENLKGGLKKLEGAEEDVSKANNELQKKNKTMTKGFWQLVSCFACLSVFLVLMLLID